MVYIPYVWQAGVQGGTPITVSRLNYIEQGLARVSEDVTRPDGSPFGWANFLEDWHAVNDGVTDVAFAFNQALAAAGVLYLPPGDYLVSEQLNMQSPQQTILYGPGRILSTWDGPILTLNNAAHVVDGVTVQGAGATQTHQTGIVVYSDNAVIRNTTITSLAGCGVSIGGANVRIEDNNFNNTSLGTLNDLASQSAIYITGNFAKTINNTLTDIWRGITYSGVDYISPIVGGLIQGNRLAARGDAPAGIKGISSSFAQHQRTVNNDVSGFPDNCIDEYGGQFTVIAENNCYDAQADGIFVGHQDTRHIDITSNNVSNCSVGIRVWDGAANIEVEGNSVADCAVGIMAMGGINTGEVGITNVRIESNTITADGSQTGGMGIGVTNADGFTVADNTVLNANHEGIYVSGSSAIGKIVDNTVRNASVDTSGTWAAIHLLSPVQQTQVDDNMIVSGAEVGILLDSGVTGIRARGNRWTDVATGLTDLGTGNAVGDDNTSF